MNKDLLNILSHSNKDIENQDIMNYLSGHLSPERKHEIEKAMVDSDLYNDAMEGLQELKHTDINVSVDYVNRSLGKYLKKKNIKSKKGIKDLQWQYITIAVIIIIIIIAFVVILKHLET